ncbi:uncharacterized protein LOC143342709 [Colletes latitarsis]|uniref:uncharacterized protein LOC143342709 n=1 Tax=Colletes latitarsis TaxID=2605962 RepID=UPI004035E62F
MPAIWSSSERPISVRTVWVDGIRHAILSPDDPLVDTEPRRRSRSSRNKNYATSYRQPESRLDRLNGCFANLSVVVDRSENKTSSRMYRELSAPPYPRMTTASFATDGEFSSDDNGNVGKDRRGRRTVKRNVDVLIDKPIFRDETCGGSVESENDPKPRIMERKQAQETLDAFWNPLFERVLQWLDLSGRAQSYDPEDDSVEDSPRDEERKWSTVARRVSRYERATIQNCKLHRSRNPEHVDKEERVLQKRLLKIRRENEETSANLALCSSDRAKARFKSKEDESGSKVPMEEKVPAVWSPPGRLQLHIVMPNLVYGENASSQESLIND